MGVTNFPKGFPSGLTIRGLPINQSHPGKVFWVSNASAAQLSGHLTGSDGNQGRFQDPFATLDYAVGQCVAGRGDIIMVKPGHAETVSSATALALDVAGIAIIGLGNGSSRPTITLDTITSASIGVGANNISIKNVVISANFADIVSAFTLTTGATAKYFTLENMEVKQTATDMNFLHVIDTNVTANAADGLYIDGLKWISIDAATLAMALVDGTNDDWTVKNSYMNLGGTTTVAMGFTIATTKFLTNLVVLDNIALKVGQTDGSAGVWLSTDTSTCTGYFARNYSENTDPAGNILMTATSGIGFGPDNYHSGEQNEHGVAITTAFNNA